MGLGRGDLGALCGTKLGWRGRPGVRWVLRLSRGRLGFGGCRLVGFGGCRLERCRRGGRSPTRACGRDFDADRLRRRIDEGRRLSSQGRPSAAFQRRLRGLRSSTGGTGDRRRWWRRYAAKRHRLFFPIRGRFPVVLHPTQCCGDFERRRGFGAGKRRAPSCVEGAGRFRTRVDDPHWCDQHRTWRGVRPRRRFLLHLRLGAVALHGTRRTATGRTGWRWIAGSRNRGRSERATGRRRPRAARRSRRSVARH